MAARRATGNVALAVAAGKEIGHWVDRVPVVWLFFLRSCIGPIAPSSVRVRQWVTSGSQAVIDLLATPEDGSPTREKSFAEFFCLAASDLGEKTAPYRGAVSPHGHKQEVNMGKSRFPPRWSTDNLSAGRGGRLLVLKLVPQETICTRISRRGVRRRSESRRHRDGAALVGEVVLDDRS